MKNEESSIIKNLAKRQYKFLKKEDVYIENFLIQVQISGKNEIFSELWILPYDIEPKSKNRISIGKIPDHNRADTLHFFVGDFFLVTLLREDFELDPLLKQEKESITHKNPKQLAIFSRKKTMKKTKIRGHILMRTKYRKNLV